MSLPTTEPYPEDGFFDKVRRQVRDDHAAVRMRNRHKRAVWAQAPAMQMAANLVRGPFGLEPEGEAEYAEMLVRLQQAMSDEPLVHRYGNHLQDPNLAGRSNTEWWHALGHQYLVALGWARAQTRDEVAGRRLKDMPIILDERLWMSNAFKDVGPREIAFEWAGRTLESKTYLWHQNTLNAALAAPLVPHVVQPNALPFESLFFSFEWLAFEEHRVGGGSEITGMVTGEHQVQTPDGKFVPYRVETWWMQLSALGDAGMMLLFDRQYWPINEPQFIGQTHHIFEPIPWGAKWPEDFEKRPFKAQIGAVLRMLAFMQAPFVDTTLLERKLPRPIRREYDRANKQAPLKEVSIITLRAKLYEPTWNGQDDHEVDHDRYKHSWWVNGHYRWQWYPREKTHKLIAVAPYMKQIGKPLLPQIRDVSR